MKEPIDLNKKRVIPEVTYSVVENLGWDSKDKKQRKIGTITQLQFLDLQDEMELVDINHDKLKLTDDKTGELLLECKVGDKYHQLLLEVGLNTVLDQVLKWDTFWESEHGLMFGHKESDIDEEWTPLDEGDYVEENSRKS
jgi:hypothetical protein